MKLIVFHEIQYDLMIFLDSPIKNENHFKMFYLYFIYISILKELKCLGDGFIC